MLKHVRVLKMTDLVVLQTTAYQFNCKTVTDLTNKLEKSFNFTGVKDADAKPRIKLIIEHYEEFWELRGYPAIVTCSRG